MKTVNIDYFIEHMEECFDYVNNTKKTMLIETDKKNAVLISLKEYEKLLAFKADFLQKE